MSERKFEEEVGDDHGRGLSKVQMEALFGHFSRMMKYRQGNEKEVCDKRIGGDRRDMRNERRVYRDSDSYMGWHDDRRCDYGFRNDKTRIPSFNGEDDPKAYLDWEKKVESVFECQNYPEATKVRRACSEFIGYASTWWDKLLVIRRRCGEGPIVTWDEIKRVMRKHFAPNHQNMRSGIRDLCEEFCASMRRPRRKEESVASPTRDSRRKAPKHKYQGTHNLSNFRTRDIRCWCLESGHDISQCPKEEMTILDPQVEFESNVVIEHNSEVEIVVDGESKFVVGKVEEANDFPQIDECIELYAVEKETLDDVVVPNVLVEEEMTTCNALMDVCPTSDICSEVEEEIRFNVIPCSSELVTIVDCLVEIEPDVVVECELLTHVEEVGVEDTLLLCDASNELVEGMCGSLAQLISEINLYDQLNFQKVSENKIKCDMVERKSDEKSEMTIERKKEENEKEAKEKEKKNKLMAQKSELEQKKITMKEKKERWPRVRKKELKEILWPTRVRLRDFNLHKLLKVFMYKEVLSHCDEKAGSIPSVVNFSLQDYGGVLTSRQRNFNGGQVQWDEPQEFNDHQGEVMVVVNTTTKRLLLRTKYRRLPVVDGEGKLIGLITRGNVVQAALQIKQANEKM